MSGKTKILVLHMKEVIYTGIFIFLGIIFLILLAVMFLPKRASQDSSVQTTESSTDLAAQELTPGAYTPGVYTAALEVSGSTLEMQVIIEESGITDVSFTQLDEAVQTMYPLFSPVLEDISNQFKSGVSLENITYEDSQKYTASILLETIQAVLEKAAN